MSMRKKLLRGTTLVVLLTTSTALAADPPSKKAAPLPPPIVGNPWSGPYVGAFGGYTWSDHAAQLRGVATEQLLGPGVFTSVTSFNSGTAKLNTDGFFAGGTVGWNHVWERMLFGVEGEFAFNTGGSKNVSFILPVTPDPVLGTLPPIVGQVGRAWDWVGTVGPRVGVLVTPTLLAYAKGGFAFGRASDSIRGYPNVAAAFIGSPGQVAKVYPGWFIGGGLEWMFHPDWSAKIEYEYIDLGNATVAFNGLQLGMPLVGTTQVQTQTFLAAQHISQNVMKAGVNYHFSSHFSDFWPLNGL